MYLSLLETFQTPIKGSRELGRDLSYVMTGTGTYVVCAKVQKELMRSAHL